MKGASWKPCAARTLDGKPCTNHAVKGDYCGSHRCLEESLEGTIAWGERQVQARTRRLAFELKARL